MAQAQHQEIEAEIISSISTPDSQRRTFSFSHPVARAARALLLVLLAVLPLLFGGVHDSAYLPAQAVVFVAVSWLVLSERSAALKFLREAPLTSLVLLLLTTFSFYLLASLLIRSVVSAPHPVLGSSSLLLSRDSAWEQLRTSIWSIAILVGARIIAHYSSYGLRVIARAIIAAGCGVSLIALSHWFYDNGKLFWSFAPEYVFISNRARWPFVNSDHLAHFLLPVFFLMVGVALALRVRLARETTNAPGNILTLFSSSKTTQRLVFSLLGLTVAAFGVFLAIAGTLSRGAWCALAMGTVVYLLCGRLSTHRAESLIPQRKTHHRRRHRSSQRPPSALPQLSFDPLLRAAPRLITPLISAFAASMFLLFLNGRGLELIDQRIEFSLTSSKDDIRWQLYQDTLSMISEHPLFGVGPGGWAQAYPAHMTPTLAGINPVHAHSEPLEALAEFGVVGMIPLVLLVIAVLTGTLRAIPKLSGERTPIVLGLVSGLCAFLVASCFDFPLRIPANLYLVAFTLSLLLAHIEPGSEQGDRKEPR